jgi:methyl-coenzyme M reductase gamma subunit
MSYKPQYCPGQTHIAENRRKQLDPSHKLEKLRDVTDKDIVLVMGHRAPGSAYKSAHPPLAEQQEPACPIRKLVTPTDGAKAGDRVRYIQFTDSMFRHPRWQSHSMTALLGRRSSRPCAEAIPIICDVEMPNHS